MKKRVIVPLFSLLLLGGLAGCANTGDSSSSSQTSSVADSTVNESSQTSSTTPSGEALAPIASFAYSELSDNAYGGWIGTAYEVLFYEDNLYQMVETQLNYAYSMVLGTSSVTNYGTYVAGESEDGYTSYTLNAADESIVSSFSLAGGYSICINTADPDQTYPVEMPAENEGEKNMANSKDDVIAKYGTGTVIYTQDGKNNFTFTDPNDESSTRAEITTASGDTSALLGKTFDAIQLNNEFTPASETDSSSWVGTITQIFTFTDGTYEINKLTINYGYSMVLATTTLQSVGDFEAGDSEDGFTRTTLKRADDVLLNSFSLAGGFNIQIDTRTAEYPVELPAQSEGEKNMAQDKDDVLDAYGQEVTYYFNDSALNYSTTDPNA